MWISRQSLTVLLLVSIFHSNFSYGISCVNRGLLIAGSFAGLLGLIGYTHDPYEDDNLVVESVIDEDLLMLRQLDPPGESSYQHFREDFYFIKSGRLLRRDSDGVILSANLHGVASIQTFRGDSGDALVARLATGEVMISTTPKQWITVGRDAIQVLAVKNKLFALTEIKQIWIYGNSLNRSRTVITYLDGKQQLIKKISLSPSADDIIIETEDGTVKKFSEY